MKDMGDEGRESYPSGRPPWDTWNGLRVGILTGGVLGIVVSAFVGFSYLWLLVPGAFVGGAIGYWSERHKRDFERKGPMHER